MCHELTVGKDLLRARVVLVETPDDMCPSDDARINVDFPHGALSETFRE